MAGPNIEVGIVGEDTFYMDEYNINATKDTYNNSMRYQELLDKFFNEYSMEEAILYSLLFILAAGGNVPVFITLIRNGHRKSRLNMMVMHLTIADLIVTLMIPLEIAWRLPQAINDNQAGNLTCKILVYMRQFGHYLSSTVLVCISLDKLFTVVHSLNVNEAQRRCKIMLGLAWTASILNSIPQVSCF
ncbi:gonadotropin-releasing hormone receptor [Trichonephila clavata]|uniref:Gonadotropin-releasing hormone receptor n=1 Tax=Trichonephila clavata TaxID=2740835 RepID=A0A8X6HRN8_TRICU|nr:gonadotropin-releasing hormone receptor [Trichonephila clavata]